MTAATTTPLLMGCSRGELRAKLGDPDSPLAPWWRHLLTLSRVDPVWYSPYTVLAAVVTDELEDRERARQSFLRLVQLREEGETSNEAQFHTHVTAAPLGRWAVFYDWVADMGLFTPEEDAAIRETFLDHAFVFPLQHCQSRYLSFDNQIMANAFGAAAVGYVLGVKRGDCAVGRRLFSTGLNWLRKLMGRLPVGGYSPEGSTYHEQVVQPLTVLSSVFIEETTGDPVFAEGLPPACRPARELLQMSYRMIGPGGLLPAWDAYGFQAASIRSGLVYLARLSGDQRPLAAIRHLGMWYRTAHPAWEIDDRLWTLVWWPAGMDAGAEADFPPWLNLPVAGALQEAATALRLFQYWDECGGAPSSGRSQVDPNAITLEAFNSPIFLDGAGRPSREVLPLPVEEIAAYVGERTLETIREYVHAAWGGAITREQAAVSAMDGSVGMSNALVLDGEGWYVPLAPRSGCGEALRVAGPLQVLRSDATPFYTDRYDVCRVRRTSALLRRKYLLISDRVTADSPHGVTWQAYLREAAEIADGRVVVRTPEQVRCDIIPLQAGDLALTPVEGYPTHLTDGRSVRFQHAVAAAADQRVDMALAPQSCLETIADLTDGWLRYIKERADPVSLSDAYLSDPGCAQEAPRRYQRHAAVTVEPGRRYFLTVGLASRHLVVAVNGQDVAATTSSQGTWEDGVGKLPWVFEVTAALRDGDNVITLTAPYFHGESAAGPVRLAGERATSPVSVERLGTDAFAVTWGEETDQVLLEREGGAAPWAGGETDARYALLAADGTLAAADVTHLSLPGGPQIRGQAPCDLAWTPSATTLARVEEGTSVDISWPEGSLFVEMGGCLQVTYRGTGSHRLGVSLSSRKTVVVNGAVVGQMGGAGCAEVALELAASPGEPRAPATAEEVYALAAASGVAAGPALVEALRGDDWRVQLAAADVIGRLRIAEAAPVLLERFAEGEAELPYPPLTRWWHWSKMLRGPYRQEGPDPDAPRPLAVKRWRVKRAVVAALGKLGDQRAVAPLEAALLRCDDFFPVTSVLGVALGRLGSPTSIPVLERHVHHAEINTRVHARLALALLKGEIDRAEFESRVGPD